MPSDTSTRARERDPACATSPVGLTFKLMLGNIAACPRPRATDEAPTITLAELPGRPCAIAASLEVVGDRWSLLVVREVALGNHRFTEIARGTGAPRDRLTARLRDLVDAGVLERRPYQGTRCEYHLTASGRELVPILERLYAWGRRHAVAPDDPDRHRRAPWRLDEETS